MYLFFIEELLTCPHIRTCFTTSINGDETINFNKKIPYIVSEEREYMDVHNKEKR